MNSVVILDTLSEWINNRTILYRKKNGNRKGW